MFSLRRFCFGAALGLSLLACSPARAKTNLLQDGNFSASHLSKWSRSGGAHVVTGRARFTGTGSRTTHTSRSITTYLTPTPTSGGGSISTPTTSTTTNTFTSTHIGHTGGKISPKTAVALQNGGKYSVTGHLSGSNATKQYLRVEGVTTGGITKALATVTGTGTFSFTKTFTPSQSFKNIAFYGHALNLSVVTGLSPNASTFRAMTLTHIGLYKLASPGPVGAPEVDPEAGAPALALALGGLALMAERRRRKLDVVEGAGAAAD